MIPLQAFLLGLSNGGVCLAYCAPVLVPCLMGSPGSRGIASDSMVVFRFLMGRLLGYLLFGVAAWALGRSLPHTSGSGELFVGVIYLVLSILLILYGFLDIKPSCDRLGLGARAVKITARSPLLVPGAAGLATGLNFCPPFLIALVGGAQTGTLQGSLTFFFSFFLGTAVFFLPAPLLGLLRTFPAVKTVGKMAIGLVGLYYCYSGIIMVLGGIKTL